MDGMWSLIEWRILIDHSSKWIILVLLIQLSGLLKEVFEGRGLWQSPGIKMLAHHNAVQAVVPHPGGMASAAFQFQINILPLITFF